MYGVVVEEALIVVPTLPCFFVDKSKHRLALVFLPYTFTEYIDLRFDYFFNSAVNRAVTP